MMIKMIVIVSDMDDTNDNNYDDDNDYDDNEVDDGNDNDDDVLII